MRRSSRRSRRPSQGTYSSRVYSNFHNFDPFQRDSFHIPEFERELLNEIKDKRFIHDDSRPRDRRTWHPEAVLVRVGPGASRGRRVVSGSVGSRKLLGENGFGPSDRDATDLRKIKICRDRKERRETLFSLRRIGRGKGGPKRRRLTPDSEVRC